jgi:hypothetical protein
MLSIEEVIEYCEHKGKDYEFSLEYIKKDGDRCLFESIKCLGVFKAETMRIIFPNNEVRKIIINSIIAFNGQEVIH